MNNIYNKLIKKVDKIIHEKISLVTFINKSHCKAILFNIRTFYNGILRKKGYKC